MVGLQGSVELPKMATGLIVICDYSGKTMSIEVTAKLRLFWPEDPCFPELLLHPSHEMSAA